MIYGPKTLDFFLKYVEIDVTELELCCCFRVDMPLLVAGCDARDRLQLIVVVTGSQQQHMAEYRHF